MLSPNKQVSKTTENYWAIRIYYIISKGNLTKQ